MGESKRMVAKRICTGEIKGKKREQEERIIGEMVMVMGREREGRKEGG